MIIRYKIFYGLVFGSIFLLTSIGNYFYPNFIPNEAPLATFCIMVVGFAIMTIADDEILKRKLDHG